MKRHASIRFALFIVAVLIVVPAAAHWLAAQPAAADQPSRASSSAAGAAPQSQVTLLPVGDATIREADPATHYGTDPALRIYSYPGQPWTKRLLLRFDLGAGLPAHAWIQDAR